MSYAIVYDSKTGNTERLARGVADYLPQTDRSVFGSIEDVGEKELASAGRVYVGFWTKQGDCTKEMAEVLAGLGGKEVFLFGTAGFGVDQTYLAGIMERVVQHVPESAKIIGTFMCQGEMPQSTRDRYEQTAKEHPDQAARMQQLIENYDAGVGRPDSEDIALLRSAIQSAQ